MADISMVKYTALLLFTLGCSLKTNGMPTPSSQAEHKEIWEINQDGSSFFGGDMLLTAEQAKEAFGIELPGSRVRRGIGAVQYWPDATIPYTIHYSLTTQAMTALQDAMEYIANRSCIRFRERQRKTDDNYLTIGSADGCWSGIGMVGGEQSISLGSGCEYMGTAVHELLHTLGFFHEQSRSDRDEFISVIPENIIPGEERNFDKLVTAPPFDYPYDYGSIMHYGETYFSVNGLETLEVIGIGSILNLTIGQREAFSQLDLGQLRELYGCYKICPDGWIWEDKSCYKFVSGDERNFKSAWSYCQAHDAVVLHIESQSENDFIKGQISAMDPDMSTWRTGGSKQSKSFVWYTGKRQEPKQMTFTNWKDGVAPKSRSVVLVFNFTEGSMQWEGVSANSRFPFICEKEANMRDCSVLQYANGQDYRGTLDYTIDGITCQKWSEQYPHNHTYLPYPLPENSGGYPDGLGDHAYCRNPEKSGEGRRAQPWCFTGKESVEWQYCDVTVC